MTEQIPINIFNWGPCVIRVKVKEDFRKLLLDVGKKSK